MGTSVKYIIGLLLVCLTQSAYSLTLSKEERKEFRKVKEIGCIIDFSELKVEGMELTSFIPFYAETIEKSEQYVSFFFESLPEIIRTYPKNLLNRNLRVRIDNYKPLEERSYLSAQIQKYNVIITLKSLTQKGAIEATVKFYKDDPSDYYEFMISEDKGKWNDDFILIKEKMATLGADIAYKIFVWGRDRFPKRLIK